MCCTVWKVCMFLEFCAGRIPQNHYGNIYQWLYAVPELHNEKCHLAVMLCFYSPNTVLLSVIAQLLPLFSDEAWTNFLLGTHKYGKVFALFNSALLGFHRNMDNALLCGLDHLSTSDYDSQVKLFLSYLHITQKTSQPR